MDADDQVFGDCIFGQRIQRKLPEGAEDNFMPECSGLDEPQRDALWIRHGSGIHVHDVRKRDALLAAIVFHE